MLPKQKVGVVKGVGTDVHWLERGERTRGRIIYAGWAPGRDLCISYGTRRCHEDVQVPHYPLGGAQLDPENRPATMRGTVLADPVEPGTIQVAVRDSAAVTTEKPRLIPPP